jgi:hypothetical protein
MNAPAGGSSEWTVETLRQHIDERLDRFEDALDHRFEARDMAIVEAQKVIETRLLALNELRREVTTDRGQLVQRQVFDARMEAMDLRVRSLESYRARAIGVASVLVLGAGAIGAFIVQAVS